MALAARRGGGRRVPKPISGPTGGPVIEMKITDAMRAAHIMVCGDAGTGKVMRVRRLAEESLANQGDGDGTAGERRRVIYFTNNDRAFGLASEFDVARIGVNTHNLQVKPDDGEHFAKAALELRQSIVFDFGEMSPEDVSTFLSGFIGVINMTKKVDFDVFFECLDDLIGRKRHRDRSTANTFRSLLLRGPVANGGNGVRVTVGATSPDEVPIETSRHSLTVIGTRTGANENVKSLSACVGGNPTLYQCTVNVASSIRAVQDEQQWLWPMSEGSAAPFMPYYCPLTPLQSDAGSGDEFTVETTDAERAVIGRVVELRAAAEPVTQEPQARRRATRRADSGAGRTKRTQDSSNRLIRASGVGYCVPRSMIARLALRLADGSDLEETKRRPTSEVVTEMKDDRYHVPARWMSSLNTSSFGTSPSLLALAYMEARETDVTAGDAFFGDLKASGPVTADLRGALADSDAPALSQARLEIVRSAFAAYIGGASPTPTAANDDVAIAQAI